MGIARRGAEICDTTGVTQHLLQTCPPVEDPEQTKAQLMPTTGALRANSFPEPEKAASP